MDFSSNKEKNILGSVRFAEPEDAPFVYDLLTEELKNLFIINGLEDINNLISHAVMSITQLDKHDQLIGFMALKDYPRVNAVHSCCWQEFIWYKFRATEMNARNSLFMHLVCFSPSCPKQIIENLIRVCFMHDAYLYFIGFVKMHPDYPFLVKNKPRIETIFKRMPTTVERGFGGTFTPSLSVAERREVCPRLRVRRAVEEDNDDIVPIIERQSTRLRELYGEFYISELVARHPESERVLMVCEYEELAVGVMCLNTQINFKSLEESFDLAPFAGLRHLSDEMKICKLCHLDGKGNDVKLQFNHQSAASQVEADSISQHGDLLEREEFVKDKGGTTDTFRPFVEFFEEDEEEVEFEIINIPSELFTLQNFILIDDPFDSNEPTKRLIEEYAKQWKKSRLSVHLSNKVSEVNRFVGTSNAFLMELFAMDPDFDERYGFDMLDAAYELFPDKDYCILSVPSGILPFPLLEHFTLVAPYANHEKFISESLYVAHINSIKGDFRVRLGECADATYIKDILENSPNSDAIWELFMNSIKSYSIKSFVMLNQNQPVGLIITGPLEDSTTVRSRYILDPECVEPGADGIILAAVVSPVMEVHSRWFLRDVLRQSAFDTLFWASSIQAMDTCGNNGVRKLMSLTERMVPVRPRLFKPTNVGRAKKEDKAEIDTSNPFALWQIEKPFCSLPKVCVNQGIVVVGASRTGLAFLESLIIGPISKYLTFTNLSLISEHGLPIMQDLSTYANICIPRGGRYSDYYLRSVPFQFYVEITTGVMVKIDRKNKCIHLKGGAVKYYDDLVLSCGHQFQTPDYMKEAIEREFELSKGKPCERILMDNPKYKPDFVVPPRELPENLMLINTALQAVMCLKKLTQLTKDPNLQQLSTENPVVVYGDCVEAYCCISALLALGVEPQNIVFVEPFPAREKMRVNCFNDETVDERVQDAIEDGEINVYRECTFLDWRLIEGRVSSIKIMSYFQCIKLRCFALFYYGLKGINVYAYKAMTESGLVYDGGLVVGPSFETNDPFVYGAGPCVHYSRRLYADKWLHHHYCPEDVGEALAEQFMRRLNPFAVCDQGSSSQSLINSSNIKLSGTQLSKSIYSGSSNSKLGDPLHKSASTSNFRRWQPVMKFQSPIWFYAVLPRFHYYFKLRKPGEEFPMEIQLSLPNQGHSLVTDKDGNYFRLHMNQFHCIDAITYLCKEPFSFEILIHLYGKQEAYCNKLLYRYETGKIDDLYDYFSQPWFSAQHYENFGILMENINQQEVGTLQNLVKLDVSENKSIIRHLICPDEEIKRTQRVGTFRSILNQYMAQAFHDSVKGQCVSIPVECGHPIALRAEAANIWEDAQGGDVAFAHVARHILRYGALDPNYARPKCDNLHIDK